MALARLDSVAQMLPSVDPFIAMSIKKWTLPRDGNGRMGRLLITFYLCRKGVLHKPLLYLSYYFKKNRQEYYDRLNVVRETGD